MGVYPIFVEACKATPPNVWLAYMLNHMHKEKSVDLKYQCVFSQLKQLQYVIMAPKTPFWKAFVLSVVFQFSPSLLSQTSPSLGFFPSLRGTSASRLTVERCKAWIKSSPKTTLEAPEGTQLEGVNHQTKPGEDLDQP